MKLTSYTMMIATVIFIAGCGNNAKTNRTVIVRCDGVPEKIATFELFVNGSRAGSSEEQWPYSKFVIALSSHDYVYGKVIARNGVGAAGEIQYSDKRRVGESKEIIIDTDRSRLSAP